jgi:hypothetical protein
MLMRIPILFLTLLASAAVGAQTLVSVENRGRPAGDAMVHQIMQTLHKDPGVRLVSPGNVALKVAIQTIDATSDGNTIAYGITWLLEGAQDPGVPAPLVDSTVGVCELSRIDACAAVIAARTSQLAAEQRATMEKMGRQVKR